MPTVPLDLRSRYQDWVLPEGDLRVMPKMALAVEIAEVRFAGVER